MVDYEKEALGYHEREPAGKLFTGLSKPISSQRDLSIAYSPGVAGPCREIHKDREASFRYTGRANLVGVVTNGSAVLGLGNIGPHAAKPVMEGKAVLFKKFADIDVFDIELDAPNPDDFIKACRALEPTFGGINLEDIKAPECFYIEEKLREQMSIPVFHDDQHGTAIIASSAFLNALEITGRKVEATKVVFSGAGAAAIACANLFIELGVRRENIVMCDSKGVITKDRMAELDPYKAKFALDTDLKTLAEALDGADAFIGVSVPDVVTGDMLKKMADNPIVFALSNPDPEVHPDVARAARPDAIIATGRSDFPNQVNNVLGFPFIFRGALDVQATTINEPMKLAAVQAIAALAKEDVPEEVLHAYQQTEGYQFGRDYLIPKPVDPRVLLRVAPAVAQAAIDSGVARVKLDMREYHERIERILGPTKRIVRQLRNQVVETSRKRGRRPVIVLPHGHDSRVIKAAAQVYYEGDVNVVLLGNPGQICAKAASLGFRDFERQARIIDPVTDPSNVEYADQLFSLRQRKGVSRSAATQLLRNHDYYAAMMVKRGEADGLVSGLVEPYADGARPILEIIGTDHRRTLAGIYLLNYRKQLYFLSDCTINVDPTPEELADIAMTTAALAKQYSDDPVRLALLSFSSFGSNRHPKCKKVARAAEILREREPDFIFDGEMQADVALNERLQEREFPFCKLNGQANVLIFPDLSAANIAYKIIANLPESSSIGPILVGPNKPANVMERSASTEQTINMIYFTANQAFRGATT